MVPSAALAAAVALLSWGCYPEFRFGEGEGGAGANSSEASTSRASASSSSGGGEGGDSVSSTSTSAQTTTSSTTTSSTTSTGAGTPMPELSCNDGGGTTPVACDPGERCCFDEFDPADDSCSAGACAANQLELRCDGPEDCPGQECCARMHLSLILQEPRFDGPTECVAACSRPDHVVCHSADDCGGGACVPLFDGEYTYYAPEYAQAYRVCRQ
jgi:hypothetical protein